MEVQQMTNMASYIFGGLMGTVLGFGAALVCVCKGWIIIEKGEYVIDDKSIITWRGKELEQCAKEELISCINDLIDQEKSYFRYRESKRNEELQLELKIKDAIINRMVCR